MIYKNGGFSTSIFCKNPRVNQKIPHESHQFLRRGIVGRDHYGVFPLRGKLRNVRELTVTWQGDAGCRGRELLFF